MRKAPAPGAEVAAVVVKTSTHPPTGPVPDRGRCRKDARECALATQLTALLLGPPHCSSSASSDDVPPRSVARGRAARGGAGRTVKAVKSAYGRADGGHGRTPVSPATVRGAAGAKRPSGTTARPRGKPRDERRLGPLGSRTKSRRPGVIALVTRPGVCRRAWNGPTPKGGSFTSISGRGAHQAGLEGADLHGRTNRTGSQNSAGATRGVTGGGEEPPTGHRSGARHTRGPVVFADAASGRSTPSGVAACNDRTSSWPRRDSCPGRSRPLERKTVRAIGAFQ
jgi:hypothetical protein